MESLEHYRRLSNHSGCLYSDGESLRIPLSIVNVGYCLNFCRHGDISSMDRINTTATEMVSAILRQ